MKIYLLGLLLCSEVFAAGGSGHGQVTDIIPNAVNLSLLIIILTVLLKSKLSTFFSDKSESVSEMVERAEIKAKEAQLMMEKQRKKIEGADAEITKLKSEIDEQISSFETEYSKEVDHRIIKMKEDAGHKIEAEKVALMNALNSSLLDQVIVNAKKKIKSEGSLKSKATESLIGEL